MSLIRSFRERLHLAGGYFTLNFRNRNLRLVQLAFAAAFTAEATFTIGLGVIAMNHGGAKALGVVALLRLLPAAITTPLLAPIADRIRRDHVLVGIALIR